MKLTLILAALVVASSAAAALVWYAMQAGQPVYPLPKLRIDPQRVAVAGFSSGAIMAQQMHLAYSDRLSGAALLSGPPYHCSEGSLETALSRCTKAEPQGPDAASLAARVEDRSTKGELAPLQGLIGDRVFAVHGKRDVLVPESIARASLAVYEALPVASQMSLQWDGEGEFAHVWPTLEAGGDCGVTASPYIGKCGRDFAAEAMRALFGAPARAVANAAGQLQLVHLSNSDPDGLDPLLDEVGYFYRPPQCDDDSACGLLIVFHGCEQTMASVGDAFAREAGFNRWADAYDVAVLYPQVRATYMPLNPKACWDWWGYSGPDYDTRKGVQLRAVANMAAALGAPLH